MHTTARRTERLARASAIEFIARDPGCAFADRANACGTHGRYAFGTQIVNRVLAAGLAVRDDREHGRYLGLYLTPSGEAAHTDL